MGEDLGALLCDWTAEVNLLELYDDEGVGCGGKVRVNLFPKDGPPDVPRIGMTIVIPSGDDRDMDDVQLVAVMIAEVRLGRAAQAVEALRKQLKGET